MRCARLAINASGIKVQLREIILSKKLSAFLACSSKGTVPVIVAQNEVIEQSLEIMRWELAQSDPDGWLKCHLQALIRFLATMGHLRRPLTIQNTRYGSLI